MSFVNNCHCGIVPMPACLGLMVSMGRFINPNLGEASKHCEQFQVQYAHV